VTLSVRKDHQTRTRAGDRNPIPTTPRPLALQRAAAELVDRIPALRTHTGIDDTTGRRRSHIGTICDLLVAAGIDTTRWTGRDIATALNHDGAARGWTWPTLETMTSPLRLVAYRLSLLDWTEPSPTEQTLHGHTHRGETPAAAAHRLTHDRRRIRTTTYATHGAPASEEHRHAMRQQLAADLAAQKATAAVRSRLCLMPAPAEAEQVS